jgi:hypothetical protein
MSLRLYVVRRRAEIPPQVGRKRNEFVSGECLRVRRRTGPRGDCDTLQMARVKALQVSAQFARMRLAGVEIAIDTLLRPGKQVSERHRAVPADSLRRQIGEPLENQWREHVVERAVLVVRHESRERNVVAGQFFIAVVIDGLVLAVHDAAQRPRGNREGVSTEDVAIEIVECAQLFAARHGRKGIGGMRITAPRAREIFTGT